MEKWILENKDWVVPLSVALLSLVGALIGGWLSGRKRIGIEVLSKNRQEWIHLLRNRVTEFLSKSSELFEAYSYANYVEVYKQNESPPNLLKLQELYNYLELLLNLNENKSNKILSSCHDIIAFFYSVRETNPSLINMNSSEWGKWETKLSEYQRELTKNTQDVLKEEWERVKKGV